MNSCAFSPCRTFRYTLDHGADLTVFDGNLYVAWIGLNPSTADQNQLDPTLRRVRRYTLQLDYGRFVMLNLFAFRATQPKNMRVAADPIGPENDRYLWDVCRSASRIICCWGSLGTHQGRHEHILKLLAPFPLYCLGVTTNGQPKHPLYLAGSTPLVTLANPFSNPGENNAT